MQKVDAVTQKSSCTVLKGRKYTQHTQHILAIATLSGSDVDTYKDSLYMIKSITCMQEEHRLGAYLQLWRQRCTLHNQALCNAANLMMGAGVGLGAEPRQWR
eukprot:scaffold88238_cov22-Tisochrysis_lutea.AAC.1